MNKLKNHKVKIQVENDTLIMYGTSTESAGCILRGVMQLQLQETTKIRSIGLELEGKMTFSWKEGGVQKNSQERLFRDEKSVLSHKWTFLPKQSNVHIMKPNNYAFEFELALPGDLPESTHVNNLYNVQYQLKAVIERPSFLMPNMYQSKALYISRQLLPLTPEFLEPVILANQWANKLNYEITLPTKIYTHGDQIPITVRIVPLVSTLRVRHLSCTLKEYMVCHNQNSITGDRNTRARTHVKVLSSIRDEKFGKNNAASTDSVDNFMEWTKVQIISLSSSPRDVRCDIHNESIRIKHKIKFVLSLINADGHVSELRAALPVIICAVNHTGLPAYEETWRSLPYDPAVMLIQPPASRDNRITTPIISLPPLPSYNSIPPPNYDEIVA